jgi:hypothetical protein
MKRLVALELLVLAGLVDVATFLMVAPATVASQELNPLARLVGPSLGVVVLKVAAIVAILITVWMVGRIDRRVAMAPYIGVAIVAAMWAYGAWTNVAYGLL